jgi:hypothetical protein
MSNIITDADDDEEEAYLSYLLGGEISGESDPMDDSEWSPVNDFPVEIGIDDVDKYLVDIARRELATVKRLFLQRAYGGYEGSRKNPANVEPMTILQQFLNPEFMGLILSQINKHITGDRYSADEMMAFVRVQMYLCFYRCSPTAFFDPENQQMFPGACTGMSGRRYSAGLKALGKSSSSYSDSFGNWRPPMKHDRNLASALECVRKICAELCFVPCVSILSIDDDLLRLRSQLVHDFGLQHTNNPAKGLGVVHHGIVSICTGLYLGGHIASRGESTQECVQILLRSLSGASVDSKTEVRNLCAWDRGYGGPGGSINEMALNYGCDLLGTSQRTRSFPFTFGRDAGPGQTVISEDGTQDIYWVKRNKAKATSIFAAAKPIYGMAYRTGLSKVVLCHTSLPIAGPGKFSFVTVSKHDVAPAPSEDIGCIDFEKRVVQLTSGQRSPEWFLMRKFRITGTVAGTAFRRVARELLKNKTYECDNSVKFVLDALLIKHSEGNDRNIDPVEQEELADAEDLADAVYQEEKLVSMTNSELKALCKAKGIVQAGNKSALIERLKLNMYGTNEQMESIESLILSCWFMPPLKNEAMKLGTINESNILQNFPLFFDEHCKEVLDSTTIETVNEYGLMHYLDEPHAAFSPDAIVTLRSQVGDEDSSPGDAPGDICIVAGAEFKTRTNNTSDRIEKLLADQYGKFQYIDMSATLNEVDGSITVDKNESLKFKKSIKELSYRCQILHCMACSGLEDWLYVTASLDSVIRIVLIHTNELALSVYRQSLTWLKDTYFPWVYNDSLPIPDFGNQYLHAVNKHGVETSLQLWRAMNKIIAQRRRPLPPGRFLLPSLIAIWNRIKGGIDVFSRHLKNIKSQHMRMNPYAASWIRLIMAMVYNSHQMHQNLQTFHHLMDKERCTTFKSFTLRKANSGSFRSFCRKAVISMDLDSSVNVYQSDSSDNEVVDANEGKATATHGVEQRKYNKRDAYFQEQAKITMRLNTSLCHKRQYITGNRLTCVYCCCKKHTEQTGRHSRLGHKTTYECTTCQVPLCYKPRFGQDSCAKLFHEVEAINDPCVSGTINTVRAQLNRAPPPSRKRQVDEVPNTRSKSTAIASPRRKRQKKNTESRRLSFS